MCRLGGANVFFGRLKRLCELSGVDGLKRLRELREVVVRVEKGYEG